MNKEYELRVVNFMHGGVVMILPQCCKMGRRIPIRNTESQIICKVTHYWHKS